MTNKELEKIKWQLEELDDLQVARELSQILIRTVSRLLLIKRKAGSLNNG